MKTGRMLSWVCILTLCMVLLSGCDSPFGKKTVTPTPAPVPVGDEDGFTSGEVATEDSALVEQASAALDTDRSLTGIHHAQIQVQDYGTIEVELDADTAPITVTNFVKLAMSGFYDGLTFHRIMSGFMIQGGDPNGNGTGGAKDQIKGEFSANGVNNGISHVRGTISMARSRNFDSASSQFFIMHDDADYLDGQYAAFGRVTSGMEVVDAICDDAHPTDSNGTIPAAEQPVITRITVLD